MAPEIIAAIKAPPPSTYASNSASLRERATAESRTRQAELQERQAAQRTAQARSDEELASRRLRQAEAEERQASQQLREARQDRQQSSPPVQTQPTGQIVNVMV